MSRILVVDDDAGLREVLRSILLRIGHEVEVATDGTEALAKALAADYDAAVVDYQIPAPNGLDILNRLRDIQPKCVRLLMSGTLDPPVVEDAVNRGEIARVIRKPFDRQSFVTALDGAITGRARLRDAYIGELREGFDRQRRQLEECLSSDTLTLALQPIVRAGDSAVAGYEALLRTRHPGFETPHREEIRLTVRPSKVMLEVIDDGRGIRREEARSAGFGTNTMRYRSSAVGGLLMMRSRPDGGTLVSCLVPQPPAGDRDGYGLPMRQERSLG